jgi:Ubiquitin-activating enzyme E1 FCCH domain
MASIDARGYIDLTLFDASSQEIFLTALDYARTAFPEFEPREGSIETVLLQAIALETQQAVYAINRLPGATVEVLLRLLDVERNNGAYASATVRFVGFTPETFTVPIGTRMFYQPNQDSDFILLETTSAVTGTQIKNISSIDQPLSSTTVTVVTSTRHGFSSGDTVTISGTGVTQLNASNKTITVIDGYTFTYTLTSAASHYSASTGEVTPSTGTPATAFVTARTTTITEDFNGLEADTTFTLLSVLPMIGSVTLETSLLGGVAAETDAEYFNRATAILGRLSAALTTSFQIEQFIVGSGLYPDAYRIKVVDNNDATRAGGLAGKVMIAAAPADVTSTNFLSGYGDGSVTVDDPDYGVKDEIYDGVAERIYALLDAVVVDPALVTFEVTAEVKLPDGITAASSSDACEETLANYLSPNTWDWSTSVRVNELIYKLRNTYVTVGTLTLPATDYVSSVTITPTDAYIPSESTAYGIASVARDGSNVCTVTTVSEHGVTLDSLAGETLWIAVDCSSNTFDTATVAEVTEVGLDYFKYTNGSSGIVSTTSATGAILPIKRSTSGDITIYDPAPLALSGTHVVTAVA